MQLSAKKIRAILDNPAKSAEVVNLVYISDHAEGIERKKRGKHFYYVFRNEKIKDKNILQRIRQLVIPPAWTQVWICACENGHLQATGLDTLQRKQYKYHQWWNAIRNHTKYYRLYDFGKSIPTIRQRLEADLKLPGMPQEKVLAAVVSLMELTSIRIGSNLYEKLYGSFGLTTLKDKHVKVKGTQLEFTFKGKKGVAHCISVRSKRLAAIVKKCKDIPGKELFQYINDRGERKSIDSGMVNNYIKSIGENDFTAKDFRTWAGSVQALAAFREVGMSETVTEAKRKVVAVLDMVSKHLGNTRTVCKKYYVHPLVITLYENKKLQQYFDHMPELEKDETYKGLSTEEKMLMQILQKETVPVNLPGQAA